MKEPKETKALSFQSYLEGGIDSNWRLDVEGKEEGGSYSYF